MTCLCNKYGDKFGCGDGWTICGGHCLSADKLTGEHKEDREMLIDYIDRLYKKTTETKK